MDLYLKGLGMLQMTVVTRMEECISNESQLTKTDTSHSHNI
jgi:hypothetical protein